METWPRAFDPQPVLDQAAQHIERGQVTTRGGDAKGTSHAPRQRFPRKSKIQS